MSLQVNVFSQHVSFSLHLDDSIMENMFPDRMIHQMFFSKSSNSQLIREEERRVSSLFNKSFFCPLWKLLEILHVICQLSLTIHRTNRRFPFRRKIEQWQVHWLPWKETNSFVSLVNCSMLREISLSKQFAIVLVYVLQLYSNNSSNMQWKELPQFFFSAANFEQRENSSIVHLSSNRQWWRSSFAFFDKPMKKDFHGEQILSIQTELQTAKWSIL